MAKAPKSFTVLDNFVELMRNGTVTFRLGETENKVIVEVVAGKLAFTAQCDGALLLQAPDPRVLLGHLLAQTIESAANEMRKGPPGTELKLILPDDPKDQPIAIATEVPK